MGVRGGKIDSMTDTKPRGRPRKEIDTSKKEVGHGENTGKQKICITCEKSKDLSQFYLSYSPNHGDKRTPICKLCVRKDVDFTDVKNVRDRLLSIDKPFLIDEWNIALDEHKKTNKHPIGLYIKNIILSNATKTLTYKDSVFEISEEVKLENETVNDEESDFVEIELTNEDLKAQSDCLRMLGYDPFAGYTTFDQKFLYGELILYLDEDTLEDQYKISVIIQLLNNNNQIRKIDLLINKLSSNQKTLLSNAAEIKSLTSTKSSIAINNNNLSKENAIAIKHRGDKKAGRSTLGYLMKDLRELGFENAEEDYYDMKRAYGMQVTADISNKSILSQLNFDEKDMEDMLKEQRDMIIELQKNKEDLEEKLRLTTLELNQYKRGENS